MKVANRTSRSHGAVGARAIVPRIVQNLIPTESKVLDFGAGKDAIHAARLERLGYDVDAYEFGQNVCAGVHEESIKTGHYDVVYASNVLNVQCRYKMLHRALLDVHDALRIGGVFIANYPTKPRKMPSCTPKDMSYALQLVFGSTPMLVVDVMGKPIESVLSKMPAAPVFFVEKKYLLCG